MKWKTTNHQSPNKTSPFVSNTVEIFDYSKSSVPYPLFLLINDNFMWLGLVSWRTLMLTCCVTIKYLVWLCWSICETKTAPFLFSTLAFFGDSLFVSLFFVQKKLLSTFDISIYRPILSKKKDLYSMLNFLFFVSLLHNITSSYF